MNWKKTQEVRQKIIRGKIHKKHADLRKYAKLCKREGIVSDRVRLEQNPIKNKTETSEGAYSNSNFDNIENDEGSIKSNEPTETASRYTKSKNNLRRSESTESKKNPFAHAMEIAKKRQEEKEILMQEKQKKNLEIQNAKKNREIKRKEFLQRTKRGQPILHNQIKNMLSKLQSGK